MVSEVTFLIAAGLGTLGPTLAGLAAWNSSRKNATQESVNEVHAILNSHTVQDDANFESLREQLQQAEANTKKAIDDILQQV